MTFFLPCYLIANFFALLSNLGDNASSMKKCSQLFLLQRTSRINGISCRVVKPFLRGNFLNLFTPTKHYLIAHLVLIREMSLFRKSFKSADTTSLTIDDSLNSALLVCSNTIVDCTITQRMIHTLKTATNDFTLKRKSR